MAVSMLRIFAPVDSEFGIIHFILLVCIAAVFAVLSARYPLKTMAVTGLGFSIAWLLWAFVAAKFFSLNLIALPIIFTVPFVLAISHFAKLWRIDSKLTEKLVAVASTGSLLSDKPEDDRVETSLRLLETIYPIAEVIVFNLLPDNSLVPVGRARQNDRKLSTTGRNTAWQENVSQCEHAIEAMETVVKVSEYEENAAKLALPLACGDEVLGVLYVDIKDDYQEDDKSLLESFAEQLARNIQRDELKTKSLPHRNWWSSFSNQSTQNRLYVASLVEEIIKEKSFGSLATAHLDDAHAVAYLDGTLAYSNTKIRELADLNRDEIAKFNLFSLLDRFRTLVFNEPSIAIRRVLQTGKQYSCELDFPKEAKILQLRITPVTMPIKASIDSDSAGSNQPACLLITLNNIAAKKENERLRSDMANLMSHELRTPITSISGFAEILLLDSGLSDDVREQLSIISNEATRASAILSNFLSVANLQQSDKLEVDKMPVKVNKLVRDVVDDLQASAKQKRIRIVEKQSEYLPPVSADRGLITKAITQLLDNAIKYSPERTSVIISTILETDFLRVDVEDRGYGIPKGEQQKIWQKFYRVARNGQDKEVESTGLGLSLVKEIAEQHNGEATLESTEGRGSCFSLRIPRL
jgi:signal transduction histidine kinase